MSRETRVATFLTFAAKRPPDALMSNESGICELSSYSHLQVQRHVVRPIVGTSGKPASHPKGTCCTLFQLIFRHLLPTRYQHTVCPSFTNIKSENVQNFMPIFKIFKIYINLATPQIIIDYSVFINVWDVSKMCSKRFQNFCFM